MAVTGSRGQVRLAAVVPGGNENPSPVLTQLRLRCNSAEPWRSILATTGRKASTTHSTDPTAATAPGSSVRRQPLSRVQPTIASVNRAEERGHPCTRPRTLTGKHRRVKSGVPYAPSGEDFHSGALYGHASELAGDEGGSAICSVLAVAKPSGP